LSSLCFVISRLCGSVITDYSNTVYAEYTITLLIASCVPSARLLRKHKTKRLQQCTLTKGAVTFQKLGVSMFRSCLYKRLTYTAVKRVEGEEWERLSSSPADLGVWGCVASSPSGSAWVRGGASAANDFGRFMCNFMRFHTSFSAFNSCREMGDSYIPLLAGVMFPFNFFGVSDTQLNLWGVRTRTVAAPLTLIPHRTLHKRSL